VYEGAFLVPESGRDLGNGVYLTGLEYGIQGYGAFAYNPDGDGGKGSLFLAAGLVAGNPNEPVICEISIPEPKTSDYNRAILLQDFQILGGTIGKFPNGHSGTNGTSATGMLYKDGYLYFTAAGVYRGDPQATTLFRRSADLSDNTIDGPYSVVSPSLNQRAMGSGMGCPIPENWQATFGGATLMGGGGHGLSLLYNVNYGPGFWVINHNDMEGIANNGNIPGTAILRHTHGAIADGGTYPYMGDNPDAFFCGISTHRGTVMLPDYRTVLVYGPWAANTIYDSGGKISGYQQPISLSAVFDRFLLYDARDLKDAFDGVISDDEGIMPYAVHDMDFCFNNDSYVRSDRGGIWDVENRRFFVLEDNGGGGSLPIIHVLRFTESFDPAPDSIAPLAISNLAATTGTSNGQINLSWTATGDDGSSGTASKYDIRYSTSVINSSNFDAATEASGEPYPATSGSKESFSVDGLIAGTTYYFAIKASDGVNWSAISNVPSTIAQENGVVNAFDVKINFQPGGNSASTPIGYLPDEGYTYGNRGNKYSYGWGADNTAAMRYREDLSDFKFATFGHMYSSWEIEVPSGSYKVHVVSGDNDYFDSKYVIDVEGITVIDAAPTTDLPFVEGVDTVNVSDGRLTVINGSGASNNKICFIEIISLDSLSSTKSDCNGDEGGDAFKDECGNCVDGNTGQKPCIQDCEGTWGGTAVLDSCGVCGGEGTSCLNTVIELSGNTVNIYPIPVIDVLTIKGLTSGMIKLYNMNGILLQTTRVESNAHYIDMTTLAKGVYILNVTNEHGSESITIQK
jgi:hypothetical protein